MRIRLPLLTLVFGGLLAGGLAMPDCAAACSCAPAPSLREAAADPASVVVVGRVGPRVGNHYSFAVERWFTGPAPVATLRLQSAEMDSGDGAVTVDTCGRSYAEGQRLLLVGPVADGQLATSICSLGGDLGTPDGMALVAEAEGLWGAGLTPPQEPTEAGPRLPEPPGGLPWEVLFAGGAAIVGLGLFVVVALLARRGRSPGDERR